MPELDWNSGHNINTGTATAVTTALAASSLTYAAGIHPLWDLAVGAAGALGAAVDGARRGHVGSTLAYRAGLWLSAGGWCSWAAAGGPPWSLTSLAVLAGGGLFGRLTWNAVGRAEQAAIVRRRQQQYAAEQAEQQALHDAWGGQWEERLTRVAKIPAGTRVVAIQPWAGNTGYTVEADLPGGTTVRQIKPHEEAFGSDLRLPEGCGVEVAAGRRKGTVIVRVSTVNVMEQTIPYPLDIGPTSIDDEFAIGLHRDGTPALGSLAHICGLGIGDTGSGKTNTLTVVNAQLVRTIDALVWHIDTTGAGLSLPWLTSWAIEGTHKRPVIDWSAHTHDETRAMLTMAVQIIETRKRRYQKLMRQANDTKLPARADVPAIIIVVDETADLPGDIKGMIETVMNTGRAVRVRVEVSSLRATSDSVPVAVKKRAKWRWGMYVTDPEELSYLFAGYQNVDPADAPWPGCGFNAYNSTKPRPFKAYALTPDRIDAIAAAVSARRPVLDEISASVEYGKYYPSRWARVLPHLYEGETLHEVTHPYTDVPVIDVPTRQPAPAARSFSGAAGAGIRPGTPEWSRLFPARGQQPEPAPEQGPDEDEDEPNGLRLVVNDPDQPEHEHPAPVEDEANAQEPQQTSDWYEPEPQARQQAAPRASAQDTAMRLLLDAGPQGTGPSRMETELKAMGFGTHRATISAWLRQWTASAEVIRRGHGTTAYYVHRSYARDHEPGDRE
ncbi:hypothetical protein ACGFNV_11150 [Streptomyces sp. NPDC048751]|uniref:hypothetical protein n=1 Tax=Streptomyces sp. NPDC048751 TaxID=3365591 RepID=UPI00371D96C5